MIRLLATMILSLLANTIGLFACSLLLDGFSITGIAFVASVVIFTIANVILEPLITRIAITSVPALRGGVALVTAFLSLVIANLLTDGIHIANIKTWVLATLIVWLFAVISSLILPLFIFKKTLNKRQES